MVTVDQAIVQYIAIYSSCEGSIPSALTVQTDYGDCCPYIVQYNAIYSSCVLDVLRPEGRIPGGVLPRLFTYTMEYRAYPSQSRTHQSRIYTRPTD